MIKEYKSSRYNFYFYIGKVPYVFNSFSGGLSKFEKNKELFFYVKNNKLEKLSSDTLMSLEKQGFVVCSNTNEVNRIIHQEKEYINSNNKETLSFVIAPTLKCNFKCIYCFEKGINFDIEDFPEDRVYDFILKLINDKKPKKVLISWFGGEPLLMYEKIINISKNIKDFTEKKNILFTTKIVTNGSLLSYERAANLVKNCNLKSVQITIDGDKEIYCKQKGVDSKLFNTVLQNILQISSLLKVNIRLNCLQETYFSIKNIVRKLIEKCNDETKLKNINFYLAKITNYDQCNQENCIQQNFFDIKKDFDNFLTKIKNIPNKNQKNLLLSPRKTFCGLRCINSFIIGPIGELYKCEHDIGKKECIVGDINNGYYYNDYYMNFVEKELSTDCQNCNLLPLCMGGCITNGKLYKKGYECILNKKELTNNIRSYLQHFVKCD